MAEKNFFYDALGQLIQDKQEKIENIVWRVDGKISDIYRVNGTLQKELSFVYDAMGNRVAKNVLSSSGSWIETEFYVRDAQGNVMAIYKKYIRNNQLFYDLTEQHIYGSSRLGVDRRNVDVIAAGSPSDNVSLSVKRGEKHYELSNHLGNVLATVSDKKIAVMSGANLSYYRADVVSYSDYYPFGAPMTERTAVVTPTDVRYGFQGQEEDDELWSGAVSFKYRVEDARLGRFFSVDPLAENYPHYSPFMFAGNAVIWARDMEGLQPVVVSGQLKGYIVEEGQDVVEVMNSINDPNVQKLYGYEIHRKITVSDILKENSQLIVNSAEPKVEGFKDELEVNIISGDRLNLKIFSIRNNIFHLEVKSSLLEKQNEKLLQKYGEIKKEYDDLWVRINERTKQDREMGGDPKAGARIASYLNTIELRNKADELYDKMMAITDKVEKNEQEMFQIEVIIEVQKKGLNE